MFKVVNVPSNLRARCAHCLCTNYDSSPTPKALRLRAVMFQSDGAGELDDIAHADDVFDLAEEVVVARAFSVNSPA